MSDEEREEMDDTASMAAAFDLEHIPWKAQAKHYKTLFAVCMPPSQYANAKPWRKMARPFRSGSIGNPKR